MSSGQSDFLSRISWPYLLRIWEWPVEWAGAALATVDHADIRESTQLRRAVVITRPQFESRRFLSLGTRVSETLPPNDNEGSPVTAPLPAHSSIHSQVVFSAGCLACSQPGFVRANAAERSESRRASAENIRSPVAAHCVFGFLISPFSKLLTFSKSSSAGTNTPLWPQSPLESFR